MYFFISFSKLGLPLRFYLSFYLCFYSSHFTTLLSLHSYSISVAGCRHSCPQHNTTERMVLSLLQFVLLLIMQIPFIYTNIYTNSNNEFSMTSSKWLFYLLCSLTYVPSPVRFVDVTMIHAHFRSPDAVWNMISSVPTLASPSERRTLQTFLRLPLPLPRLISL